MKPYDRDKLKLMVNEFGLPAVLEALSTVCVEKADQVRRAPAYSWSAGERDRIRVWARCARFTQCAADQSREYLTGAKDPST